jgi:uncharacterized membrane protein
MVQPIYFMDFVKLYFAHIFWLLVLLLFIYAFYVDNFKIKKQSEYMSDEELMERFNFAVKKGLIKLKKVK